MLNMRPRHGDAAKDQAETWTRDLREIADIADFPNWSDETKQTLIAKANELSASAVLQKVLFDKPDWASPAVIEALLTNSKISLKITGYEEATGLKNAAVPSVADSLIEKLGVRTYVEGLTGLKLLRRTAMWYVIYDVPGASLGLHIDTRNFGDVAMLLCLDRVDAHGLDGASATTFVTTDGIEQYIFQKGECLLFDGVCTPHARTPVREGERVVLLVVGFSVADEED